MKKTIQKLTLGLLTGITTSAFSQTVTMVQDYSMTGLNSLTSCYVSTSQRSFIGTSVINWSNDDMASFVYQPLTSGFATTGKVSDFHFIDSLNGFLVTNSPAQNEFVWKTTDGGSTWTTLSQSYSLAGQEYTKVRFANSNIGYAMTEYTIRSTTNGGTSWGSQTPNIGAEFKDLDVRGSLAWACGNAGKIIKTTNGGVSWTTLTSGTTQNLTAIQFIDEHTGFVFGSNGTVIKTTDGGITWTPFTTDLPAGISNVHEVQFTNPMNAYISRNDGFYHSTDGGSTWTLSLNGGEMSKFQMLNSNLGIGIGPYKVFRIDGNCPIETSTVTASASSEYVFGNDTLTASGVYTKSFANQFGCDSIVALNLSICSPSSSLLNITACESYDLNGTIYNTTGQHIQTIPNATGCDSTITLNLNINTMLSNTITENDGTLLASDINGTSYSWINCTNNALVPGISTPYYTPLSSGSYAMIIENGSCADTSVCISVDVLGINDLQNTITAVYPNPANTVLNIYVKENTSITIVNLLGSVISTQQLQTGNNTIDINGLTNGIYFIQNENGGAVKFVKE